MICAAGSGAIGISIAKNSSINSMYLVDISKEALKITKKNISLNNVNEKCKYIYSNFFTNLDSNIKVDLIVSNPPYIKKKDLESLDEYVKKEPILALDGGETGMDAYVEILNNAKDYLKSSGLIIFEIGYDEKEDLKKIINGYNYYKYLNCIKDYAGNDRVVVCRFHQK